jgi:YggT family protein
MFEPAIRFLLDTAFGLITYAFLLRFAMQWLRAPFRNPLGQAVVALTDWAVKPARQADPRLQGARRVHARAGVAQPVRLALHDRARPRSGGFDGSTWATFALLTCVDLLKALIWLLIIVVIVQALLSWVAPDGPLSGTLNAMTFRFLAPIRALIPPLGARSICRRSS